MFGIDAPELLIIAVVALVVIGPKELPTLLRTVGRWVASMRVMASEFRGHVDDMVRQSELDELKKSVEQIKENTVLDLQALDPTTEIRDAIAAGEADAQKLSSDIKEAISGDAAPADTAVATAATDVSALPLSPEAPQPLGLAAAETAATPITEPAPAAGPEPLGMPLSALAANETAETAALVADEAPDPAASPVATIPPAEGAEPKKSAA